MKNFNQQVALTIILLSINIYSSQNLVQPNTKVDLKYEADWTIVGAGPAAISALGMLLELGVNPLGIIWIDPEFNVGRLSKYTSVPANSKLKDFVSFLQTCKTFTKFAPNAIEKLKEFNMEQEYSLKMIVDPLQQITDGIRSKVKSIQGSLKNLTFENNLWKVEVNNKIYSSMHVILATGSHPKTLNFKEHRQKEIPLDKALDKTHLVQVIKKDDVVAVIGSAHSAILVLKYLSEIPVKQIINFHNKPIQYTTEINGLVYNPHSGIKGIAAYWAKNYLEKNLIPNLIRIENKGDILKQTLPKCTKIIYALGFERNTLPQIKENPNLDYNADNGIIAPRLFGIGIAFPEKIKDGAGNIEPKVGLNSFIDYAQRNVPIWMQCRVKKNCRMFNNFEKFFEIKIL